MIKTWKGLNDVIKEQAGPLRIAYGNWLGYPKAKADLLIVGEGPGKEELRQRKAMVGLQGKMVRSILRQTTFSKERVYLTNALKFGFSMKPAEIKRQSEILAGEIALTNPKIILALGRIARMSLNMLKQRYIYYSHPGHWRYKPNERKGFIRLLKKLRLRLK